MLSHVSRLCIQIGPEYCPFFVNVRTVANVIPYSSVDHHILLIVNNALIEHLILASRSCDYFAFAGATCRQCLTLKSNKSLEVPRANTANVMLRQEEHGYTIVV